MILKWKKIIESSPFKTLGAQLKNINGDHGTIVINYDLFYDKLGRWDFEVLETDLLLRSNKSAK
jgi:hypothetical protein